jgi:hypothetical protein
MKLGIVLTNEDHGEIVLGLLETAAARDWQLRCFLSDTGVNLVKNPRLAHFCQSGHWVALCELSLERYHINTDEVLHKMPDIIIGGQYQDAELVKNSDKVLVF